MNVPWWTLLPLAALAVTLIILSLRDGRSALRRLLDEARGHDGGDDGGGS